MEIIFIRHGPPEFDSSRWLHQSDLGQLLANYKASRVVRPAPADLLAELFAFSDKPVFCSTLPRCTDSAAALGFTDPVQMPELDEADLPNPNWLKIPVSYQVAIIALRFAWFLGYSEASDSYRATLKRADTAAAKLSDIARVHGSVLVVGHGIMNRLVSSRLRKVGWNADARSQTGYWSVIRVSALLSNGAHGAHT